MNEDLSVWSNKAELHNVPLEKMIVEQEQFSLACKQIILEFHVLHSLRKHTKH